MDKQTEFVLRTIEERDIRFVRLWFTDVLGFLKSGFFLSQTFFSFSAATSFLFLAAILVLVGYLTVSKRDVSAEPAEGF